MFYAKHWFIIPVITVFTAYCNKLTDEMILWRQLLIYADYVNILGGSTHTVKKNTEALTAANKEIGLAANAERGS